jgi:hypothetical protein
MSTLTIRLPDSKRDRLRSLAKSRGISMNRLVDELATVALVEHDAEVRFRALAQNGSAQRGLELLDRLDQASKIAPARKTPAAKGPTQKSGSWKAASESAPAKK